MRILGYLILILAFVFFILFVINFFQERNKIHSPIPENQGIKVIQITPTK